MVDNAKADNDVREKDVEQSAGSGEEKAAAEKMVGQVWANSSSAKAAPEGAAKQGTEAGKLGNNAVESAKQGGEAFSKGAYSEVKKQLGEAGKSDGGINKQLGESGGKLADKAGSLADKLTQTGQSNHSEKMDKLSDKLSNGNSMHSDKMLLQNDSIASKFNDFPTVKSDGTHDLKTGDRLVVKDGKETLVTPNGDVVTVGKDGEVKVEGEIKSVTVDPEGRQVYTMSDGARITVGNDGISSVERNGRTTQLLNNQMLKPFGKPDFPHFDPKPWILNQEKQQHDEMRNLRK